MLLIHLNSKSHFHEKQEGEFNLNFSFKRIEILIKNMAPNPRKFKFLKIDNMTRHQNFLEINLERKN